MRLRLIHKLLIALFASTALVLLLIVLMTRFSFGRGFEDFLRQQELARLEAAVPELAGWYEAKQSWEGLSHNPRLFHDLVRDAIGVTSGDLMTGSDEPGHSLPGTRDMEEGHPPLRRGPDGLGPRNGRSRPGGGPMEDRPGPGPNSRGAEFGRQQRRGGGQALHARAFLLDANMTETVGDIPPGDNAGSLLPIESDGSVVGWLGVAPIGGQFAPEEEAFIQQQRNTLVAGLGGGLLVAALLAWLLSRHLGRPVSAVASGIHTLAAGDFQARVHTHGNDEIAQLGRDVNRLARVLSENEQARQRWMADIAHELRTPLAIILGEVEAMSDGVRPLSVENLSSVNEEVHHLKALVDDLHKLALSDSGALAYKLVEVDLAALVDTEIETARGLAPDKDLEIRWNQPDKPLTINGDEQRLRQLLRNLLENSIRYTDTPGKVEITLEKSDRNAILQISDSAPGATGEQCAQIFERFHRLEGSRNRNSGGSGLGLAICRNIVEAHGGAIVAEPGALGGLSISVSLPVKT